MTVPNILTVLRMLLVPVMVYVFKSSGTAWALVVYAIASLTDILDGYIARKYNQITNFGKLMDPLADKLMVLTMLFMLSLNGYIPWLVFILSAGKELLMVLGALFLLKGKKVVVMANKYGKSATAAFCAGIALVCLSQICAPLLTVGRIVLYAAIVLAFVAMATYARAYFIEGRNDRGDR